MGDPDPFPSAVEEALHEVRRRWPQIRLDDARFVAHVCERHQDDAPMPEGARLCELYLACAAADQDPTALAELKASFFPRAVKAVARLRVGGTMELEVETLLWEGLILPRADGKGPRIAEYGGQGPLSAWICACAVRFAQMELRAKRNEVAWEDVAEETLARQVAEEDPELEVLRARFREDFRLCFERALAGLTVRERNLLRLNLVERLTIDDLSPVFGAHRATIARWLAGAREQLLADVRQALKDHLRVESGTLESLFRAAAGGMEISLRQLLKSEG
jgi:RNA polymerase sigma-70 factor (ECF subfamily)